MNVAEYASPFFYLQRSDENCKNCKSMARCTIETFGIFPRNKSFRDFYVVSNNMIFSGFK